MRRHEPWILTCTVLWLSACSSTLPRPVVLDNDNALVRRQAEVRTRWIGVTKFWTRTCPAPRTSDWAVRPLIPLNKLEPALARSVRKAKLNRFCVYEYKGSAPVSTRLTLPRGISARLRSVEPDRIALSGMSPLQTTTSPPFSQLFFNQVQRLTNLQVAGTSRVRLAFLDTQPTGEGIPQPPVPNAPVRSRHGYTLEHIAGHLAGTLACKDANTPCAIQMASRLALPVVSFDPETQALVTDTTFGGYRGTFADLNKAILDEINGWLAIPAQDRPPHLVLNLSIGWDGEKLGGWDEDLKNLTPGPWIVYGTLKAAADQGILVIAAAGNERSGPTPTGHPLLPAGWEKPVRRLGGAWVWKNDLGAPFIYAASGVDGWGHPLVNTRKYGEAPRVAYADHVVVPDLNDLSNPTTQYTATLTGTSVAAAVVSTAAAVIWSYRPELTPAGVMSLLDNSGVLLTRKHDFSVSADATHDVRRITLCRAVAQARNTSFDTCGAVSPSALDLSDFEADTVALNMNPTVSPSTQHPDLLDDSWIGPLPGSNPCPNCVIDPPAPAPPPPTEIALVTNASLRSDQDADLIGTDNTSQVLIEIPDDWAAGSLQQATLELFCFNSSGRRERLASYSILNAPSLVSGDQWKVPFDQPSVPFQAALSFVLAPPADAPPGTLPLSIVSPLFVGSGSLGNANCPAQ